MSNLFSGINARLHAVGTQRSPTSSTAAPLASDPSQDIEDDGGIGDDLPRVALTLSPSLSQSLGLAPTVNHPQPWPLWLNARHSKHIVKGDFTKLSVRPKTVDAGEWAAYQGM